MADEKPKTLRDRLNSNYDYVKNDGVFKEKKYLVNKSGNVEKYKEGPNRGNPIMEEKYRTEFSKRQPIRTKTVVVLFLLAFFYVILAIVAAEIYNQSGNKMKDATMNQNSYTYIITSMTVAITIVITLLLGVIADQYRLGLFLWIFGIFGIATCSIGIQWLNNSDTLSEEYVKGRKVFMGVGIGFWIFVILGGIFTFVSTFLSK